MGDRGNIRTIDDEGNSLYMYAHWDRYKLHNVTAAALDRGRGRWGDVEYLNRIIFSELVKDDVLGETGYGLSVYITDGDETVTVDHRYNTVTYNGETLSFDEFVERYRNA